MLAQQGEDDRLEEARAVMGRQISALFGDIKEMTEKIREAMLVTSEKEAEEKARIQPPGAYPNETFPREKTGLVGDVDHQRHDLHLLMSTPPPPKQALPWEVAASRPLEEPPLLGILPVAPAKSSSLSSQLITPQVLSDAICFSTRGSEAQEAATGSGGKLLRNSRRGKMQRKLWEALLLTLFPAVLSSIAAVFVIWLPEDPIVVWLAAVFVMGILGVISEHSFDFIAPETRSIRSGQLSSACHWKCWRLGKGGQLDMPYDPYWNGANGFMRGVPAPWSAPVGASAMSSSFIAQLFAIAETASVLFKFLVFLAFARFAPSLCDSTWSAKLALISRSCLCLHACLCGFMGLICGHAMREMPNVFSEDRRTDRRRNILSIHLMLSGAAVGTFGVGCRIIRHLAEGRLDECCIAGIQAPTRLLAVLSLDLPHLVLGLLLIFVVESSSDSQELPRIVLASASIAAATVGILLAIKTFRVDLRWFVYGGDYRRRREYLDKKAKACGRWKLMNKLIRQQKHEAAIAGTEL